MKASEPPRKRHFRIAFGLAIIFGSGVSIWALGKVEHQRFTSPDGAHTAIVTYRRYSGFLPGLPGQGSDKSGFITIEDSKGKNYGTIPIPMLWMSQDFEWTENGARIRLVGEWNFKTKEYRYSNEEQTKEYVKRAR